MEQQVPGIGQDVTSMMPPVGADVTHLMAGGGEEDIPRDTRGRPLVSSSLSDGPPSNLEQMLGPLAHPQTFTDFARLLTLPVDTVRRAAASAVAMAGAKGLLGSARQLPEAAARGAVNATAAVGDVVSPDVIGAVSPRAGKVVEIAQRIRDAQRGAAPAVAAESVPAAAPAAAPTVLPPGTGVNNLPDQKALNEAALAARRAAYQASQQGGPVGVPAAEVVKASGKMRLTAPEFKEFQRLIKNGMSLPEAEDAVKTARDLADKLGAPPPPVSATKFPKGMRGKTY
jgi:hypothetical protein